MIDYPLSTTLPATPASADKIALANDLHRQCTGLADRVQALGQRMWQTAVALGYTLTQVKAELPHGEYTKLFEDSAAPNVAHVQHLAFSRATATRYVNLYKAAEARVRKLGDDQAAAMRQMIEQGSADELSSLLGEVSQASSLREAYIELGVIQPPKTPQESMLANRCTTGRPKGSVKQPTPWEEAREMALHRAAEIACHLSDFIRHKQLDYLRPNEIEGLRAAVSTALADIKAYRPATPDASSPRLS